jgi:hypothetical protein
MEAQKLQQTFIIKTSMHEENICLKKFHTVGI